MSPAELDAACRALPGATMTVQWGDEEVYKVGGRMFAVTSPRRHLSLKVSDIAFEALIETGRARAAPYLARAKWVLFDNIAELDAEETRDWLKTAHALVAAKLTRAQRAEIGL
jgi:predicted DNA-binding protein (MmcQ/YjbR family)